MRPISVLAVCNQDLPDALIDDLDAWCDQFPEKMADIETLITNNRIFKQRNVDIGVVSKDEAFALGFFRGDGQRVRHSMGFAARAAL